MKEECSAGIIPFSVQYNAAHPLVEYLLLRYQAGHWDFPKGHIEGQESLEQAAQRELTEETGLIIPIIPGFKHCYSYLFKTYTTGETAKKTVCFFTGESKVKVVTLSDEHTDFAWLSYDQAHAQLTYQNAQALLKKLHIFITKQLL